MNKAKNDKQHENITLNASEGFSSMSRDTELCMKATVIVVAALVA